MRTSLFLITLLSFFSSLTYAQTTKVLFIGNSITYYNNMPQTFEAIANDKGNNTAVTMYAPGGTGFINHAYDQNVFKKFRAGGWDYIVLQPGSNESPGYSYTIEETLSRARILLDSAYKYNPCAKILFYEISYGVWGITAANLTTYNTTMDLIRTNLIKLADSTKNFIAPVGEAFRTSWNNDQNDMLWVSAGDIHPNAKGSYIAACVFYATIFQEASEGTAIVNSLTALEAENAQKLADQAVLNNLSDWRINTYLPNADFQLLQDENKITFTSTLENIDSVYWDFNDGNSSVELNPTHTYNQSNDFQVTLTAYQHHCPISITKSINISNIKYVSVTENEANTPFGFYPNPVIDKINIQNDNISAKIYALDGSLLLELNELENDISSLPKGIYLLIQSNIMNGKTKAFKLIKM